MTERLDADPFDRPCQLALHRQRSKEALISCSRVAMRNDSPWIAFHDQREVHRSMDDHPALRILQPDERVEVQAPAGDTLVVVTDRRMAVATAERLMLDVPIDALRRIQFDIERKRPATLVIVPEERTYEPQVLAIEPSGFEAIARALVTVGLRFAGPTDEEQQTG